jgi:hypothetical protein
LLGWSRTSLNFVGPVTSSLWINLNQFIYVTTTHLTSYNVYCNASPNLHVCLPCYSFSLDLLNKVLCRCFLFHTRAPFLSHVIHLDRIIFYFWRRIQSNRFLIRDFPHLTVTFSTSGANNSLNRCSNTLHVHSSCRTRDKLSQSHKNNYITLSLM